MSRPVGRRDTSGRFAAEPGPLVPAWDCLRVVTSTLTAVVLALAVSVAVVAAEGDPEPRTVVFTYPDAP